jgi:sugar phosphate isomerase/epimerase
MAKKHGIVAAVHPHSHHTSLVLTPAEYDRLLAATAQAGIMFNPDTGHMFRGGHDVMATFDKYRDRIVHIHLKDVGADGSWQSMGHGVIDIPALLRWIEKVGYQGWIVAEEESEAVLQDAAQAIADDRAYLRSLGC